MAIKYLGFDSQLTSAITAILYTCPANTTAIVSSATAANVGTDSRLVTVNLVRSGGSVVDANIVENEHPIAPDNDDYLDKLVGKYLAAGDELIGSLDDTGLINVGLSIREIV